MQTLQIIWAFFQVGIISFGGGWSIVGMIRNKIVPIWMNETEFRSLIAIAQSTPGPIALNAATLIGWTHGGFLTSLAATLSVVAFPTMIMLIAAKLSGRFRFNGPALNESLRSGSMALMIMTLWALKPSEADPLLIGFSIVTFAISAFTKINALWVIFGAGALNAIAGPTVRSLLGSG